MFSRNEKISERQLFRNYAICGISISALLIPMAIGRTSAFSILLSIILTELFLAAAVALPCPKHSFARAVGFFYYWLVGTMAARLTGMLVQEFLLTGVALWIVLGWFYLVCYYNLYKGIECRIRVSEVLFAFFMFLLILLTALMWGEVDIANFREMEFTFGWGEIRLGYELFCWLGAVQGLWYLKNSIAPAPERRSGARISGFGGTVFRIGLTIAIAVTLLAFFTFSVYGSRGSTGLIFPLASAMTLAHFPGSVIGRLDALFVFVWVIGLFLLCSTLFAPLRTGELRTCEKYGFCAILLASFAFALHPRCLEWGSFLLYYLAVPLQFILLLCSTVRLKNWKKPAVAAAVLLAGIFLNGCGAQELEKQGQVISISVDVGEEQPYHITLGFGAASGEEPPEPFDAEAESMADVKEQYWETEQKKLDLNHLKTFYFSEALLENDSFHTLLEELQLDSAYSRGTSVYAALGDPGEQADREDQPADGTPLHRLLNAHYNGKNCEIPTVTEEGLYKGAVFWPY